MSMQEAESAPTESQEPATEEVEQAEPTPAEPNPYEGKLASVQARAKGLELELRKQQQSGKTAATELADLQKWKTELMEMSPMDRINAVGADYTMLTAEVLKSDEALTPEQEQLQELLAKDKAREERDAEAKTAADKAAADEVRAGHLDFLKKALADREDTVYASALGQEGEVLSRIHGFASKHGVAPTEGEQTEIALEVEKEVQEQTHLQLTALFEADKSGAVRKMLEGILSTSKEDTQSDEQVRDSRRASSNKAGTQTITRSATTSPGDRKAQPRMTRDQKKARALERLNR